MLFASYFHSQTQSQILLDTRLGWRFSFIFDFASGRDKNIRSLRAWAHEHGAHRIHTHTSARKHEQRKAEKEMLTMKLMNERIYIMHTDCFR